MWKKIFGNLILEYLRVMALIQLRKNPRSTIIGVTGSAGKSSACLAISQILSTRGVVKHSSLANSQSGIPLDILGLHPQDYSILDWLRLVMLAPIKLCTNREHFDYYVVEMGIDGPSYPKNMQTLLRIVRPHVGVVLNASLTHAVNFDDLVGDADPNRRLTKLRSLIANEKMQLLTALPKTGVAILNLDQKELVHHPPLPSRVLTFGKSSQADLQLLAHSKFSYQRQIYSLPKTGHPYTLAAAIAVAAGLGITPKTSLSVLNSYVLPPGRGRRLSGVSHSLIIDSSYNASPQTMLESLKHLKTIGGRHHKIAVLGDMLELGASAKLAHKNLADWISLYADEAILYGDLMAKHTLPVLLAKKFPVRHFLTMSDLTQFLRSKLSPKSVVLVKGSQNNILLERAVESILADPSDVSLLCRRGPFWDKVRANMV